MRCFPKVCMASMSCMATKMARMRGGRRYVGSDLPVQATQKAKAQRGFTELTHATSEHYAAYICNGDSTGSSHGGKVGEAGQWGGWGGSREDIWRKNKSSSLVMHAARRAIEGSADAADRSHSAGGRC